MIDKYKYDDTITLLSRAYDEALRVKETLMNTREERMIDILDEVILELHAKRGSTGVIRRVTDYCTYLKDLKNSREQKKKETAALPILTKGAS